MDSDNTSDLGVLASYLALASALRFVEILLNLLDEKKIKLCRAVKWWETTDQHGKVVDNALGEKLGKGQVTELSHPLCPSKYYQITFLYSLQFSNEITFFRVLLTSGKEGTLKTSIIFDLCGASKQQWQDNQMTPRIIINIVAAVLCSGAAEGQEREFMLHGQAGES